MEVYVDDMDAAMDLPAGFRFHPTDEELITAYLSPKVLDNGFVARAIADVDLNQCEPWELPKHAKMGEKEWYFFCVRDRKYPTGLRTNRATEAGYWKATGKDKEIYRDKLLVGMKKTLVFYIGRAPNGKKSNWVMHEYRLDGHASLQNLPPNAKNEWTICRVFHKTEPGNKVPFPSLKSQESNPTEYSPSENLPPLMESSPHVTCFSNPMNNTDQPSYGGLVSNPFHSIPTRYGDDYFPRNVGGNTYLQPQTSNFTGNYLASEQSILRAIIDNHGTDLKQNMKTEESSFSSDINADMSSVGSDYDMGRRLFDDPDGPSTSGGPVNLGNLWNY